MKRESPRTSNTYQVTVSEQGNEVLESMERMALVTKCNLQSQTTLENPEARMALNILHIAKTTSCRTHPTTRKQLDTFHARSQKLHKSLSHWKDVGELKNTQMS